MDIPVLIGRTESLYYLLSKPLITTTNKDTFRLKLHSKEMVTISHKLMFKDSLYISPGDTLVIKFSENYAINEKLLNGKTYTQEIPKKIRSSVVDSLTGLFYNWDYNNPMELFGDYDKIIGYQLKPNRDIENSLKDFKKLVSLRIALFHKYKEHAQDAMNHDLERHQLFQDLNILYSLAKNSDSLFISTKDEFINGETQFYPFGANYLYHAIYNVYFKHLQNGSRSKVFYDQFKI
jgi:hypothetical protein